jgi:hypothetical protein
MTKFFTIGNFFKILFLVIIIGVSFYFFIYTRRIGCLDKKALNYDKNMNLHDPLLCKYPNKGCRDKESTNYNLFATISCTEDCTKWRDDEVKLDMYKNKLNIYKKDPLTFKIKIRELEEKIRRMIQNVGKYEKLCKYHRPCTVKKLRSFQDRECKDCMCIPNYNGCTREWCVNYNENESRDITSTSNIDKINNTTDFSKQLGCIDLRDLANRIFVVSSGNCINCYNQVIIKLDDKYVVSESRDGLYVVNIKRNKYFDDFIMNRFDNNIDFINYLKKIEIDDIIVIAIKLTTTSFKLSYEDQTYLYDTFGYMKINFNQNINYVFVGTKKKDFFYENKSSNTEIYFPSYKIDSVGCFEIDSNKLIKLNSNNNKFLRMEKIDSNNYSLLYRSALEAMSLKKNSFLIKDNECYILKEELTDTKGKIKVEYGGFDRLIPNLLYSKKGAYINRNGSGLSSGNSFMIYHISDSFFQNIEIFDSRPNGNKSNFYTQIKYKGGEYELEEGINSLENILEEVYSDSRGMSGISSIKVPTNMLVTLIKASNNKKVSITGKKDIDDLIKHISSLISSPGKEFQKNIKTQITNLTNNNKKIDELLKKKKKVLIQSKDQLAISVRYSLYNVLSKSVGWTTQDDDNLRKELGNMLFDVLEDILNKYPDVLDNKEKIIIGKAIDIKSKIKIEQTKLDRYIKLKSNIVKRSQEQILSLYSLDDINKQIETRSDANSKQEVDKILLTAFKFLKMVLNDISSLENKKATISKKSYVELTSKRLELYSTFANIKDYNEKLNEVSEKRSKTSLDNNLLKKYNQLLPILIETLYLQSRFSNQLNDSEYKRLNSNITSSDMIMNSIKDAMIKDLINKDPEASVIKRAIDSLNQQMIDNNNSRFNMNMDYILKNNYVPETKGEIEKKQKDPEYKRIPDSTRIKIEENIIKSKEAVLDVIQYIFDLETNKKIYLQKIDFLTQLKKNYLEDTEFSTSQNKDLIMISNIKNKIVLYELSKNEGMSLPIPYGKFRLPKNSWMTIGSIFMMKSNESTVAITCYSDDNFINEIGYFTNSASNKVLDTTLEIIGENPDGSPIFYNRSTLVKSISVEYVMPTEIFYSKNNKESVRPATFPPFLLDRQVKLYLRTLRGPITRIKINQPKTLVIIYGEFINSWGQVDNRIAGYMYNEYSDRAKEVRYLYDTGKNKIDLSLITIKATHIKGKHMTDEMFKKYKV